MDAYEKLRGELIKIFKEGNNLVEGDEFWLDLISDSMDSKKVLEIAKDMKEEGNSFFKSGKIDDALEMYGYAESILAWYNFDKEDDRTEFFDLALCILLNSTVCFSRKKEFELVGQLCCIILDFQPNNVKALYRRAIAAIELDRHEWAFWDLLSASQINTDNQEVSKKLEEVKNAIKSKKLRDQKLSECPKGLGIGLPAPMRMVEHKSATVHTSTQEVSQEKDSSIVIEHKDRGEHVGGHPEVVEVIKEEMMEGREMTEESNSAVTTEEGQEEIKTEEIKEEKMEDKLTTVEDGVISNGANTDLVSCYSAVLGAIYAAAVLWVCVSGTVNFAMASDNNEEGQTSKDQEVPSSQGKGRKGRGPCKATF